MLIKKLLPTLLLLPAFTAQAQTYHISGTVPAGIAEVTLASIETGQQKTIKVNGGKFQYDGQAEGNIFGVVMVKDQRVPVILDGKIEVDFKGRKATGTPENEAYSKWSVTFEDVSKQFDKLVEEYRSLQGQDPAVVATREKAIQQKADSLTALNATLLKNCCEQNRTYRFPAIFLAMSANNLPRTEVIRLAEEGSPAYMQTQLAHRLKGTIDGWKRQMPGKPFTDLELADREGKSHKLSEYVGKGKYVLIDFWASWCGPCRREMPRVKALYEKYKDRNFDIVGLSFDNDAKAWKDAVDKMQLPWHHLSDLKGWKSIAASTYGIQSIPATLLIGPDGKIIAGGLTTDEVDKKLEQLLK